MIEIKFHLVSVEEMANLRMDLSSKLDGRDCSPGVPIDTGHGYSLTWRYEGTDLVVGLEKTGFSFLTAGTVQGYVEKTVLDIIGPHKFEVS